MMTAFEFLKEQKRMCNQNWVADAGWHRCDFSCPLYQLRQDESCDIEFFHDHAEEVISIVEQWSKEHPPKSNKQKFEEVFPGYVIECNTNLDKDRRAFVIRRRGEEWRCRQSGWLDEEYKEPEE